MTRAIKLFAFLATLLCPIVAVAGANNATLNCVSTASSGEKMRLTGSIPGDFGTFSLSLKSASSSLTMSDESHSISIIDDFKHQIFTLTVTSKDQSVLVLYGIPKTMTHKGGLDRSVDATFAAVLKEQGRNVPFSCAYHFSI